MAREPPPALDLRQLFMVLNVFSLPYITWCVRSFLVYLFVRRGMISVFCKYTDGYRARVPLRCVLQLSRSNNYAANVVVASKIPLFCLPVCPVKPFSLSTARGVL